MHTTHHHTSTSPLRRPARRAITAVAAAVLAALMVLAAVSPPAVAGTEVIYDCPAAQAGNLDAGPWVVFGGEQTSKVSCAGGPGDWIAPQGASMNAGSTDGVQVTVPSSSGLTIREAKVWWKVPRQIEGADNFAVAYANGGGVGGAATPYEWILAPDVFVLPSTTTTFEVDDYCSNDDASKPCVFGAGENPNLFFYGAQLTLADSRLPAGKADGGSLTNTGALSGTQSLTYTAEDPDTGIRLVRLLIDGQPATSNDYTSQCPYTNFQACPGAVSDTISWNTALVADGQHTLQVVAEDAAQNTSTIYTATITTRNAPTNTTPPTIGAPSPILPGSTLQAQPGAWNAPATAGAITYGYEWENCDSQGNNCQAIPGAQATSYTPTASNTGHTLRVLATAANSDGKSTQASSATGTVLAPPTPPGASAGPGTGVANGAPASEVATLHLNGPNTIHVSYSHRAFTVAGFLTDSQGHPIAGATLDVLQQISTSPSLALVTRVQTSPDGTFTVAIPAGPSRRIEIAYRAFSNDPSYTATAAINETVNAGVRLHANTRATSSTGRITLTGKVAGPIPHLGAIVNLLVYYHHQWVTIRTPRTNSHGTFHITYQFQGATGHFPFKVEIPAGQANYPYVQGVSNMINITTR